MQEINEFDAKINWTWLASCIHQEAKELGHSWRKLLTFDGKCLISIGYMKRSRLNQFGLEAYLDGSTFYFGNFVDGKLHGKGCIFWEGGARYKGEWNDGKREGKGTYIWANGDTYHGDFKNDGKKDGEGVFTYNDGDKFEGHYKNDERSGWGKMIWKTSEFEYEGNFVNNEPEDSEKSLHPKLRDTVQNQVCTGAVTGRTLYYGQFFYECECADYCSVCWNSCHHEAHASGDRYSWVRRWSDGTYCGCMEKGTCQRREEHEETEQIDTRPEKRQKLQSTIS